VIAAHSLNSPRSEVIDLSPFMCDPVNWFPVVRGVQVNGDIFGHLITSFMRTLEPFLLRDVRRLEAAW
jgi:hypothetical protein